MNEKESENSETSELFVKRRPSTISNQNEPLPISPTRKESLRRDSAWSSAPVLTLDVPQLAQNQLQNQYDAFNIGSVLLSRAIGSQLGLTKDEKKVMKSKKFQLWRAFCHFFTVTSFHGLPQLASSRSSPTRICYWVVLILIALGIMLWAMIFISIKFFDFNTFIKVEQEDLNELLFPAVTICNLNQYTLSYSIQSNYSEEDIFLSILLSDYLNTKRVLTRNNFSFDSLNTTVAELAERFGGDPSVRVNLPFSHKLENMLVLCYYNDEPCFEDSFTTAININGRCFTFNSNMSDVLYATTPSAPYGLELVLNVEQYEYYQADADSVGFRVYIHQQGDFPHLGEHAGFTVAPGTHTDVVLSIQRLEYLEPPYGECRNDMKLDYFPIYTREACLDECRTKVTIRKCGCRLFYMPGNGTVCSLSVYADCVVRILQNFTSHHRCDCPLPCDIPAHYQYALSYSAYPARHFPLLLHRTGILSRVQGIPDYIHNLNVTGNITAQNIMFNFFKENVVKITLYYNQLSRHVVTEVAEYEIFQFIADFGGHLGLFTGAGFLTFFEVIEVCMGIFYPSADRDH